MPRSDLRPLIAYHAAGVASTAVLVGISVPVGTWEPAWLAVALIALGPLGELSARTHDGIVRVSPTELFLIPAMVLLGPLPAVAVSMVTWGVDFVTVRPECGRRAQISDLWIHVCWPAAGSLLFFALGASDSDPASPEFLAATAVAAAVAVGLNVFLVFLGQLLLPPERRTHPLERDFARDSTALVVAPAVVASITIVAAYGWGGPYALVLTIVALLVSHWLVDQLVLLRERERQLEARNQQLADFHLGVLGLLTATLARRDEATARHAAAVSRWARDLAAAAGCDPQQQWTIQTAGFLHDIGKFTLPDELLHHDGPLTEPQRHTLRQHAADGAAIVSRIPGLEPLATLIRHHHERYDGSGYPDGLAGERIPLGSRILAVCEAYDAMTARDSYRMPVSPSATIDELRANAGTQFDPVLVERFAMLLAERGVRYRHGDDANFEQELNQVLASERASTALDLPDRDQSGDGNGGNPSRSPGSRRAERLGHAQSARTPTAAATSASPIRVSPRATSGPEACNMRPANPTP